RLRELNFGVFEGLTFTEAKTRYPDILSTWLDNYDQPPDKGEPFSSLTERVDSFLDDLKMISAPQTILIVSHGGCIREIIRLLLELPREKHWSFQFDLANLSEVHVDDNYSTIVRINDTQHLREV
ncbi:MAG: histidine phosphatase family protein, partial [Desulfobacula sp.]|nr:histidine phosphatase family protein [Desulfobacula sp.]